MGQMEKKPRVNTRGFFVFVERQNNTDHSYSLRSFKKK
jgi:hypothetical protein